MGYIGHFIILISHLLLLLNCSPALPNPPAGGVEGCSIFKNLTLDSSLLDFLPHHVNPVILSKINNPGYPVILSEIISSK